MATPVIAAFATQWTDDDGKPLAGGKLYFFETGTNNAEAVFSDVDLTTPYSVPLVLDSAGRVPSSGLIYPPVSPALDILVTDADDVPIWGTAGPISALAPAEEPPPVGEAPAITTEPQDASGSAGDTFVVSVVATGTAPLSYQWYLGSAGDASDPIIGAIGSSYTFLAPEAAVYTGWVRVQNAFGTADSTTVTVTVT